MFETTPVLAEMPTLNFLHSHQGEGALLAYADEEEENAGGWRGEGRRPAYLPDHTLASGCALRGA